MEGMALLLSTICLNATFCPTQHQPPNVNFKQTFNRDLVTTAKALDQELAQLAAELKGQRLNVTTLEDYPLSYVERANASERANGSGEFIGRGWAFEFFDYLTKKYNFSYNLIVPDYNIVGGSNDSEGSLMQMITKKVRKPNKNVLISTHCVTFFTQKADIGVAFVPMIADLLK